MEIKDIAEKLKNEQAGPGELSLLHNQLCGHYGFVATRLGDILMNKPASWASLRTDCTSDSQADRKWDALDQGKEEIAYRLQMKVLEKMMSSIKTRISVLQGEARNQY